MRPVVRHNCELWMNNIHDDLSSLDLGIHEAIEIWHKIGLSADWCLCTVLCTRSGACYCWIVLKRLNQSRWHKKVGLGSAQKSMFRVRPGSP